MDSEDLRAVARSYGVDLWAIIDGAIATAAREHGDELRTRRDGIVARLYAAEGCRNCADPTPPRPAVEEEKRSESSSPPLNPAEDDEEGEEDDPDRGVDNEERLIFAIKDRLEDRDQPEEILVDLLQHLADMDITFKALKETDIGRHVNVLRKHPSSEVRRLVKILVRKWKELVDDWVKTSNSATDPGASPAIITDGDSPLQLNSGKGLQNGHQVVDFGYSPNPHNGSSSVDKSNPDMGSTTTATRTKVIPRNEHPPAKPSPSTTPTSASPAKPKEQKESLIDPERLASARRRLHENYQEAQNAKKQRTIQVMDIHEIPKPKNGYIARNNKGNGFQSKQQHW